MIEDDPEAVYPIDIWIDEPDQEKLQLSIKEKIGYSCEDINQSYDLDMVMEYVRTERQYVDYNRQTVYYGLAWW